MGSLHLRCYRKTHNQCVIFTCSAVHVERDVLVGQLHACISRDLLCARSMISLCRHCSIAMLVHKPSVK